MNFNMNYLSRYIFYGCVMLVFFGLYFSIPCYAHIPDRGWEIETIDAPRKFSDMSDRSLCIDQQGKPHIAFGEDHIYHAWLEGDQWLIETVDYSPGVGEEASISIDSSGGIHIAYYDNIHDALKYAHGDGTSWEIEIVDLEGGHYPSVAVDDVGMPHIAYKAEDLNYAIKTPGGWDIAVVETEISPGTFASLALDQGGYAHISHYETVNNNLLYTFEDITGWHTELVDTDHDAGWYSSIAVDENSRAHISYFDLGNHRAAYAFRADTGWQIDDFDQRGSWTSITLDSDGTPHVVFLDSEEIYYAIRNGSEWDIECIEDATIHALYASLALDSQGRPAISFMAEDNFDGVEDLRYASKNQGIWEIETVTSAGDVGTYASLAIDHTDQLHVCYVNSSNDRIRYAISGDRGWAVAELELKGVDLDIAVDDEGHPHISYLDEEAETVNYLYLGSQGWQVEIVEDDIGFNAFTSIALDSDGIPHLAYRDFRILRYAVKSDTGWVVEVLGQQGEYTSIALDDDDNPHIGYQSWEGDGMAYAYHDGTEWHFESADPNGEAGLYNSIVIDQAGYPHMTYFDNLPDDVRYAYKDQSGWHVEIVDEEWDVGKYTSLALDSNGIPRVSYFYGMDVDLRFGYREDEAWYTYTVTSEGRVGGWSQLVLDSLDRPHVVYYSESAGDLMYAHSDVVGIRENSSITAVPRAIKLLKISPNPLTMRATVTYSLGSAGLHDQHIVHFGLYDAMGRQIRTWSYKRPYGEYSISLSIPPASQGGPVSGVYYLKAGVESRSGEDVKPVILIR